MLMMKYYPNLWRSMTDFCLESRETRLRQVSYFLINGVKPENKPIIFHNITLSQFPQKVFIMGDDDKLEI